MIRANGGKATAGMEYAMRRKAIIDLLASANLVFLSLAAASPGWAAEAFTGTLRPVAVTHSLESGEPVVVLRLVPSESGIAQGPRLNALPVAAAAASFNN